LHIIVTQFSKNIVIPSARFLARGICIFGNSKQSLKCHNILHVSIALPDRG